MKMQFIKETILYKSQSRQQFFHSLRMIGLSVEFKNGIPIGVRDGGKAKLYKWKDLGITPTDFVELKHKEDLHNIKQDIAQLQRMTLSQQKKIEPKY